MQKPSVFRDEHLQKQFDENGFVKFRMFSSEQVARLREFYIATQDAHETVADKRKFHSTNDTDNAALITDADTLIKEVMFEEMDKHFHGYKTIEASYILKQSDPASELSPHQDLSFVDEEKYYSYNIWVATEPTNKQNGCLRFLKGSHRIQDTVRTFPSYPWKYRDVSELISPYLVDVPTEIGDCIVLNHACIHASYPNLSGSTRIAAILALIPRDAEIYHYYLPNGNPDNLVEKYTMGLEDFIHLKEGQRPQGAQLIDKFHYDFSAMDRVSFIDWLKTTHPHSQNGNGFFKNILSSLFKRA